MTDAAAVPPPPTLYALANHVLRPGTLTDATLIVIDAQNEYVQGRLPLDGVGAALDEICTLLERARANATPIVHIQHVGAPGGLFDPDGPGGRFCDVLNIRPGFHAEETIIQKRRPNAFSDTNLDTVLKKLGRHKLIVTGFMTHMCVSTSVRAALDLGYESTVVATATATRALAHMDGKTLSARCVQDVSLAALADRFAAVVSTV